MHEETKEATSVLMKPPSQHAHLTLKGSQVIALFKQPRQGVWKENVSLHEEARILDHSLQSMTSTVREVNICYWQFCFKFSFACGNDQT